MRENLKCFSVLILTEISQNELRELFLVNLGTFDNVTKKMITSAQIMVKTSHLFKPTCTCANVYALVNPELKQCNSPPSLYTNG